MCFFGCSVGIERISFIFWNIRKPPSDEGGVKTQGLTEGEKEEQQPNHAVQLLFPLFRLSLSGELSTQAAEGSLFSPSASRMLGSSLVRGSRERERLSVLSRRSRESGETN